jgi:hypothetical protein
MAELAHTAMKNKILPKKQMYMRLGIFRNGTDTQSFGKPFSNKVLLIVYGDLGDYMLLAGHWAAFSTILWRSVRRRRVDAMTQISNSDSDS